MRQKKLLVVIAVLTALIFLGCGAKRTHIEEYKSGAVVSKTEITKTESKSEINKDVWTDIVQYEETNNYEIIADEIVIEDNQGNKKTFRNAVISNTKNKSDTNIVKSEKVEETSEYKAESKVSEVSEFENSEKLKDTDRKQFNWTKPIILLIIILVSIYFIRWNFFS